MVAFNVDWVLVSVSLVMVYRLVAAGTVGARTLLLGGFATGSCLAGFLWAPCCSSRSRSSGRCRSGLPVFGAVAALALWLYLIHILVLAGYRFTLGLNDPGGVTSPSSPSR